MGRIGRDELARLILPERHEVLLAHLSRRDLLRASGLVAAATLSPTLSPTLLARTTSAAASGSIPVTGRWLSYGNDPTREMVVSWQVPEPVAQPQVRFGPAGQLDTVVPAEVHPVRSLVGVDGPVTQYYLRARLPRLDPGTAYRYRVEHAGAVGAEASFETAPGRAQPFRFTACGDQGVTPAAAANDAQIRALRPAFHLLAGDISYAEPSGDGLAVRDYIAGRWTRYFEQSDPVSSRRPWMVAPGNHELELVAGPDGYAGFRSRFALPDNGLSAATGVYSFRYGNVGFVSLDANDVTLELTAKRGYTGGEQTAWLDRTLAGLRADRRVDFIVAFFHQCAYATDTAHGSDGGVRTAWVPLFDRYAVDLVVNGHNHSCERTDPLRGGQVTTPAPSGSTIHPVRDGTTYVVAGGGGIGLTEFRAPDRTEAGGGAQETTPVASSVWTAPHAATPEQVTWSRTRFTGYSFLVVDVLPGHGGRESQMHVRLVDSAGRELDHVTLARTARPAPGSGPPWLPIAVGGVGVAAATAGGVALMARRRAGEVGQAESARI